MTPTPSLPPLSLADSRATRDTLHAYARPISRIRRELSPAHPHWWHISLRVDEGRLGTPAIPGGPGGAFDLALDLRQHILVISSRGESRSIPLCGQSQADFTAELLAQLEAFGVTVTIDQALFDGMMMGTLDAEAMWRYATVLDWVDGVLERFGAELPGETSPVQLWPHHFDLALTWFSGRRVPGVDPADREHADEHMTFGFSTGDDGLPEPYFYILAYPWQDAIRQSPLPPGTAWHDGGWQGGLMRYERLLGEIDPEARLLTFLRAGHAAGARVMR